MYAPAVDDPKDRVDSLDGLGVAVCPQDLNMMNAVGPVVAPYWECPACGLIRITS